MDETGRVPDLDQIICWSIFAEIVEASIFLIYSFIA